MKIETKEIVKFLKKNARWILMFICIIAFLEILQNVFAKEIINRDIVGYYLISKYLISDKITPIAKFITNFGGIFFLAISSTTLFFVIKNKKIGLCIYLNIFISGILNIVLKNIVQRPRPTEYRIINESGYSFPSGHSMVSTAYYGFFIYLVYKYVKNKYLKFSLISIFSILIILIGISRIYLGVHYTSDVLAGFFISISYLTIFISAVDEFFLKDK